MISNTTLCSALSLYALCSGYLFALTGSFHLVSSVSKHVTACLLTGEAADWLMSGQKPLKRWGRFLPVWNYQASATLTGSMACRDFLKQMKYQISCFTNKKYMFTMKFGSFKPVIWDQSNEQKCMACKGYGIVWLASIAFMVNITHIGCSWNSFHRNIRTCLYSLLMMKTITNSNALLRGGYTVSAIVFIRTKLNILVGYLKDCFITSLIDKTSEAWHFSVLPFNISLKTTICLYNSYTTLMSGSVRWIIHFVYNISGFIQV